MENQIEEEKENSIELNKKESFLKKLWNDLKKGVKENYKMLILISLVAFLIIYINIPNELCNIKIKGGGMGMNMGMGMGKSAMSSGEGAGGNEGKKKSSFMKFNPMSGGIKLMTWCIKNILLFYFFLLFITLVPSVPIVLYITVFYFIMKGLVGKINSV